jgi:hypothetical protein
MVCPLKSCQCVYTAVLGAVVGTVQYYGVYGVKLCTLLDKGSFNLKVPASGATGTNTVSVVTCCGGTFPLVTASTGALVTVADLPTGTVWTVSISKVNGIPKGVVSGL